MLSLSASHSRLVATGHHPGRPIMPTSVHDVKPLSQPKEEPRKHIQNSACASTEQEDNVSEQQLPVIAVPSHLPIPEPAAVGPRPTVRQQHDDAVLFSCNQTHAF
ncbi:hypothetical protein EDD21DRAFT_421107 [Dissophora ornata]|nr:hypothetical protein EDD21DRAFT_421107 [Dissophora ornata]